MEKREPPTLVHGNVNWRSHYGKVWCSVEVSQKTTKNKCWRGCGEKGTCLHCWWECKLEHPLWRTLWNKTKNRTTIRACSVVSDHQAPLSMGFSRQDYWSGLPFPPPGDLPSPGIKPESLVSPAFAGGFFTTAPPGNPNQNIPGLKNL